MTVPDTKSHTWVVDHRCGGGVVGRHGALVGLQTCGWRRRGRGAWPVGLHASVSVIVHDVVACSNVHDVVNDIVSLSSMTTP